MNSRNGQVCGLTSGVFFGSSTNAPQFDGVPGFEDIMRRVDRSTPISAWNLVLADGTLAGLVRLHQRGARAVLTANLRLSRAEFVAEFESTYERHAQP